jgi:hypothetical protein
VLRGLVGSGVGVKVGIGMIVKTPSPENSDGAPDNMLPEAKKVPNKSRLATSIEPTITQGLRISFIEQPQCTLS